MRARELPEEEVKALQALLQSLVDAGRTKRAIGMELGYPRENASQNVVNAIQKGLGKDMAERIYKRILKTKRETWLAERGLGHLVQQPTVYTTPSNAERVLKVAEQLSPAVTIADARRVVMALAAYKGEVTEEEIANMLIPQKRPASGVAVRDTGGSPRDDLGPGTKAAHPARRRK